MIRLLHVFAAVMVFSAAGCSSDSAPSNVADTTTGESAATAEAVTADSEATTLVDTLPDINSTSNENTTIDVDATISENITTIVDTDTDTNLNPAEQNVTAIEFTMTVPAYMSDSLQLSIVSGDLETNAAWVGDEIWSATVSFPVNTENLLTVTFSDNNGAIVLGTHEQLYATSANASEALQITADQFDTTSWDTDEDGISNLDELLAGTDPLLSEVDSFDVRDFTNLAFYVFITESFSRRLSIERPHNFSLAVSEIPMDDCDSPNCTHDARNIRNITTDIDELGNANLADFRESGSLAFPFNITQRASRAISDSTIAWDGSWRDFSESRDRTITVQFTNTVSEVDETTRSYIGTTNRSEVSGNVEQFTTEYNLTGKTIDNSTLCEPIAGSLVTNYFYNSDLVYTQSVTKSEDDALWKTSFEIFDENRTSRSAETYLSRFLNVVYRQYETIADSTSSAKLVSENEGKFHCDLSDL